MKETKSTQKKQAKSTFEPTKVAFGVAAVASMALLLLAISLVIVS